MDVDRAFAKLKDLIKKTASDEGYISVRVSIVEDKDKASVYWVVVTGVSKKFNLKANYKLTLNQDHTLTLKFQYCSPRVAAHEIELAIRTFDFKQEMAS